MATDPTTGSGGTGKSSGDEVTPKDIWDELEAKGASSVQAAAIMGNAIAESSLDPESKVLDSNGQYSYGLWQFNAGSHPQASSLVTGNPVKDTKAQVKYLIQTGGLKAASGGTVSAASANFAETYERCADCAKGDLSVKQRQGDASEVAGWASGGDWPASAGNASDTANLNTSAAQQTSEACAWMIGGGELDLVVYHQSLPSLCILSKAQARALVSAAIFSGGIFLGLVALLMLAGTTKAGQAAKSALLGIAIPETRLARATSSGGTSAAPAAPQTQPRSGGRTQQGAQKRANTRASNAAKRKAASPKPGARTGGRTQQGSKKKGP